MPEHEKGPFERLQGQVEALFNYFSKKRYRRVLVLSSGGARGWYHIGFLKAFRETDLSVDAIIGTSAGALTGGFYSAGKIDELNEFLVSMDLRKLLPYYDISFKGPGLIGGKKVRDFLNSHLEDFTFDTLQIPFFAVAVDLISMDEVLMGPDQKNDVKPADAILGSVSIPGLMSPVRTGPFQLIDGGLLNRMPVDYASLLGAERIIAIDLHRNQKVLPFGRFTANSEGQYDPDDVGTLQILARSFDTLYLENSRNKAEEARVDLRITPDLQKLNMLEFHKAQEIIDRGYAEFEDYYPELERLLR